MQARSSFAGNLEIGPGGNSTLLAALAPSAYSTASLTVGGTLEVRRRHRVFHRHRWAPARSSIDNGGAISGDGTAHRLGGGAILNNGTIEAVADQTLGLQQLIVANDLSGSGTLLIDRRRHADRWRRGRLDARPSTFAANSIAQLANDPYSPSTLVLGSPGGMRGTISGFTFADRLVLEGVTATSASYAAAR